MEIAVKYVIINEMSFYLLKILPYLLSRGTMIVNRANTAQTTVNKGFALHLFIIQKRIKQRNDVEKC